MTQLAPDCPGHTLRGPQGPQVAPTGLSGGVWPTQGPVGASQSHSDAVRTTSGQYEYVLVYFGTRFCFANISAPKNSTKLALYSKFTYRSLFSEEKNGLEICLLVLEILNKQTFLSFFWKHPVCFNKRHV